MATSSPITVEQLGKLVKAKYPVYDSHSDHDIGEAVLRKYPQYASRVFQPSRTAVHPEARTVGNYLKALSGIPEGAENTAKGVLTSILHPINTATGLLTGTENAAKKASKEFHDTSAAPMHQRIAAGALTFLENAPMVGPLVNQAEQGGTRMGSPEALKAALEGTTEYELPSAVAHVLPKVAGRARSVAKNVGSSPRAIGKLIEETRKENVSRAEDTAKHLEKSQEEAIGLKNKQADIERQDEIEKNNVAREYQDAVNKVNTHNEKVNRKYQKDVEEVRRNNAALENTRVTRNKLADELTADTEKHYALEDRKESEARQAANVPWNRWHAKMNEVPVGQDEVFEDLKKKGLLTPQVEEQLRFIEPDGSLAETGSPYDMARRNVMTGQGETRPYENLSPESQHFFDKLTQDVTGVHPEPIDLTPGGPETTVGKLQEARSQLEERIRAAGGRGEHFDIGGVSVGRMKQVSRVLADIINKYSEKNGALGDLKEGRAATAKFKKAFGRAAPKIRTQVGIREAWLNPESDAARTLDENLNQASDIDPEIAESARKIRAKRDQLKSLPTEDQLRRGLQQVPAPPSVGDFRLGRDLQEVPAMPRPRLTSGSAQERAFGPQAQPEGSLPPERPEEAKKIDLKDIRAAKAQAAKSAARQIQHWGLYLGIVWPAIELVRELGRGEDFDIGSSLGSMAAIPLLGSVISRIIESPKMDFLLRRATPKDIASIPADLRGNLPQIVKAAKAKGIEISPAMNAAVAAIVNSHPKRNQGNIGGPGMIITGTDVGNPGVPPSQ